MKVHIFDILYPVDLVTRKYDLIFPVTMYLEPVVSCT